MTANAFRSRLTARAAVAGVEIPEGAAGPLEKYFELLSAWNTKINLTALSLDPHSDEAVDRLMVEPLAAARFLDRFSGFWLDLGSGGGSPAIPLKIAHPAGKLTLVESKSRKAAFLREAARLLQLPDTIVENQRFEGLGQELNNTADLVTVRAVKVDATLFSSLNRLLTPAGRAFLFHSAGREPSVPEPFQLVETVQLGTAADARLSILSRVFHVER